jgi:hypothetical protein
LLILKLLYRFEDFSHILILPVLISFHELVISGRIIFRGWISCPWGGNSQRKPHSYSGFRVNKQAIPGRITVYPVEGECWQSTDKILPVDSSSMSWQFLAELLIILWRASVGSPHKENPPDGNKSRIPYYEGSLPPKKICLKLPFGGFLVTRATNPGFQLPRMWY